MGSWKTCTIADLGKVVGGATPSTRRKENYDGGTIAWITPKDLAGLSGRFISRGERNITDVGLKSCSAQIMPKHSILFSSRAPIGYVAIAENEVCTNQGFKSVVPNENTDYMFLYYLLLQNRQNIESMSSGTTFKEVSAKTMRGIEVKVPESKGEQIKISSVLSAIDDKIEENERINKNLAAQAQAIYVKMFITDADPSWSEGKLSDFIEICYGKDHKKLDDGSIPVYGSGGVMRHVDKALFDQESVLIPRKGSLNNVIYINDPFWSVDTMFFTKMKKQNIAKFVYHFLKDKDLASMNSGSAVPSMTTTILNAIPLRIPDDQTLSSFETRIIPYYQTVAFHNKESEALATMRDVLLPRLMSGEIDVSTIAL